MSLTAAAAAAIVLLSLPGALGWWWDSSVTCTSYELCALKGSTVNFSCTYHPGHFLHYKYPALKVEDIYWTRGDSNENVKTDPEFANRTDYIFDDNDTSTLRISDLRENDQTQYRFIRGNLTDYYSSPNISLSVTGLAVQAHHIYNDSSHNKMADLECQSSCSLPNDQTFIWYKNGIKVKESGSPRTNDIEFDDGDSVWCAVRGHEDLHSPLVYAPVVPSVTFSVAPDDIVEGRSVTLTCGGNGATVKITWYKNDGNADIRAVGKELVFESIKSSDSGEYYCRAESQLGSQSSDSISVDVQYPPRRPSLVRVPSGDILEGSSVNLTCSSEANPAANYSWFKENERSPRASGHTFTITNLTAHDSGDYYCEATNKRGKHTAPFHLSVLDLAVEVEVTEKTAVSSTETEAKLKCRNSCGEVCQFPFVWVKNGQRYQGGTFSGRFYPGDEIYCALAGHEDHPSPTLYALVVPSVTMSVAPDDIVEGTALNLTCGGNKASVKINWYKNGVDTDIGAVGRKLIFESIKSSDSGKYYCRAESQLGSQSSNSISVDVQYPPRPQSVALSSSVDIIMEGTSVDLTCSSDANPAPTYTWYKGSQQVFQGLASYYRFRPITSKYRGLYHCKSENKHGAVNSSSLYIDVIYAPKRPSVSIVPSGGITVGSTVTLTCSSDANPAASYSWFKENQDSPEAVGQTFIITRFTADHIGDYYCQATNSRGSHSISFQLTGTGRPAFLTLNILKLMVVLLLVPLFVWRVRSRIKTISISPQKKRRDSVEEMEFQPCPDYENMSPEQEALQQQKTVRELTLMLSAKGL